MDVKLPLRDVNPKRTYQGEELNPYSEYRKILEVDFNNRCGYTHTPDSTFINKSNFHIDHFAPKSKKRFPHLVNKYSNLVYACSYVNIAKGDDWISDDENVPIVDGKGYIDPCSDDYANHFYRDINGNIFPEENSDVANYMYKRLKLYLSRYGTLWKLDQIKQRIDKMTVIIDGLEESDDMEHLADIKLLFADLSREYFRYVKLLTNQVNK